MRIIVVGSGISAMVASWAARAHDLTCWSPSGRFGGQFGAGPFRLVRATDNFCAMLDQLELIYEPFETQPGMLVKPGQVLPLPDAYAAINRTLRDQIRKEYAFKYGGSANSGMPEPELVPTAALDFDYAHFTKAIEADTDIERGRLQRVDIDRKVATFLRDFREIQVPFDAMIVACPMLALSNAFHPISMAPELPSHSTAPVGLVHVATPDSRGETIDELVGFDAIWTPITPRRALMRMSHVSFGYVCEFRNDASAEELQEDLAFALPLGHDVVKIERGLRGNVVAGQNTGKLPANVYAAGPHATGKMNTPDTTLDRMMELFA